MFKIARAARQIFQITSKIKNLATSIATKYSGRTEGYEDVSHEFTFKKNLSEFSAFKSGNSVSDFGVMHKDGPVDWVAIRKLIYARFAYEIGAQPEDVIDTRSQDTKEYVGAIARSNIADEFTDLRSKGYDFAAVKKAIQDQNVKSLSQRMKELVVSGYISNYAGESGLKEEVEEVMYKKELVINEFMARCADEIEVHSTELLG